MDPNPNVAAALIAGAISIVVGVISYISSRFAVRHEMQQAQFKDVIAKRIDLYPNLWRIHIKYETNWVLEGRSKSREWAEEYVSALNEFNLEGGVFFSQGLYNKFFQLRSFLYEAIRKTEPGEPVSQARVKAIRFAVYGGGKVKGLATYEKDDLGSYSAVSLQRRVGDA